FHRENPGGLSGAGAARPAGERPESPTAPAPDGPSSLRSAPGPLPSEGVGDGPIAPSLKVKTEAIDAAIESLWGADAQPEAVIRLGSASGALSPTIPEAGRDEPGLAAAPLFVALLVALWGDHRRSSSSRLNSRSE